jgi:hypothetical protein
LCYLCSEEARFTFLVTTICGGALMRILSVRKVAHSFKKNKFAFWELFTAANDRRQCRRHRERSVLAQALTRLTAN